MIQHNFTEKSVRELINLKTDVLGTAKFQTILSEPCRNTIAQIDAEFKKRGLYPIRLNN